MKRSADFLLRQVAGKHVLVPVGRAAVTFPGMVDLNTSGCFLWELLEQRQTMDQLVTAMTERYDVDAAQAEKDIESFLENLRSVNAIIE